MPLQALPQKPPKPLSEKETKQAMEALGKRVAYLLHVAPLTDEARAEIIRTVPFMSFEQIDDLAKMLEAGVKESGGDRAMDEAVAKVETAAEEYERVVGKIDAEAAADLDAIEAELSEAEGVK